MFEMLFEIFLLQGGNEIFSPGFFLFCFDFPYLDIQFLEKSNYNANIKDNSNAIFGVTVILLSYLINLFSGHTYKPGSTNIKKDDSKHNYFQ